MAMLSSGGMSSNGAFNNQQQNMGSLSPDYYQDIYADAIEQFN